MREISEYIPQRVGGGSKRVQREPDNKKATFKIINICLLKVIFCINGEWLKHTF